MLLMSSFFVPYCNNGFEEGVCKNLLDVYICWDINISFLEFTDLQLWLCVN